MFMESADRLKKAILSTDGNTISLKRVYEFISDILEMDSNYNKKDCNMQSFLWLFKGWILVPSS